MDPARATTPAPDPDPAPAQAAAAEEAHLGIPVDEIPPAGTCRVWLPGAPVESQSAAGSCAAVQKKVPAGAWVLHRSRDQSNVVAVNVYRSRWPVMVTETRYFDYWTGRLLRVE